jgi:hypothetical protein
VCALPHYYTGLSLRYQILLDIFASILRVLPNVTRQRDEFAIRHRFSCVRVAKVMSQEQVTTPAGTSKSSTWSFVVWYAPLVSAALTQVSPWRWHSRYVKPRTPGSACWQNHTSVFQVDIPSPT